MLSHCAKHGDITSGVILGLASLALFSTNVVVVMVMVMVIMVIVVVMIVVVMVMVAVVMEEIKLVRLNSDYGMGSLKSPSLLR